MDSRSSRIVGNVSTIPNTPNLPVGINALPAEPALLRAGDSWRWSRTFDGYAPGDGWALQYILNSPGGAFYKFPDGVAVADSTGAGFDVSLTPTQTAGCAPGVYELYAVLSNADAGGQETIAVGRLKVAPNIAAAAVSVDTRSFAKKTLDMLELAIANDSSPMVQEYEIHGRRVQYINRKELLELRERYRLEYRQERIAAGEFVEKTVMRIGF